MTMGEKIKSCRTGQNIYNKEWSQEELGKSLNPPVNRAAVNKWETGQVENIKRTHIQQLAKMFGITPCDLMCFEDKFDEAKISEETKLIEEIQKSFGKDAVTLLNYFNELNEVGKEKALNDIGDLTELPKYTDSVKKESKNA